VAPGRRVLLVGLIGIAVYGLLEGSNIAPFLVIAVLLGMVMLADAYMVWGGYLLWVNGDETVG
jgi:hypothetical protein